MSKSIFEKIIDREIDSFILYEDKDFIVFLDSFPKQNGHTLIVPKKKHANIFLENNYIKQNILNLIEKISKKLLKDLSATGIKILTNIGSDAGQVVFHTHFHLIPYYKEKQDLIEIEQIYKKITRF